MKNKRGLKQKLANFHALWTDKHYDAALAEVDELLNAWPGSPQLHVMWASLVQLQENPEHDLDDVKEALESAVMLDKDSPAALIERCPESGIFDWH